MGTSPKLVRMLDGDWGVSTITPTLFSDGTRVPNNWDLRIRKATQQEIEQYGNPTSTPPGSASCGGDRPASGIRVGYCDLPQGIMNTTPEALSGSANSHSRLPPSGSKSWTRCTRSVTYVAENRDRILPLKVAEVLRLEPYLRSLPFEEVFDYEWRGIEAAGIFKEGVLKLTEDEINDIFRTSGSEYAREGTRAHEFAGAILQGKKRLEDIPLEFQEYVGEYVAHCRSLVPDNVEPYVEAQVPLFYSENTGDTGTCDFAVITDSIFIRDLKWGQGVLEHSTENTQLAIYALSFIEHLDDPDFPFEDDTLVNIAIFQPRHREWEGVEPWIISLKELREFCREILLAAIQIRVNNPLVVKFAPAEDVCKWCDAKKFCEARNAAVDAVLQGPDFSGLDYLSMIPDLSDEHEDEAVEVRVEVVAEGASSALVEADMSLVGCPLTDDMLIRIWENAKNIRSWLDDVEELVEERAMLGETFDGRVKLVEGKKGNRKWRDEAAAEKFCVGQKMKEKERFSFKLRSPKQVEDFLGDRLKNTRTLNNFNSLISRTDPKPIVVPASDKRAALTVGLNALPVIEDDDFEI